MSRKKLVRILIIFIMTMNFYAPVSRVFADETTSVQKSQIQPAQMGNILISDVKRNDHQAQVYWDFYGDLKPDSYKIYLDGIAVSEITGNQFTLTGLKADTFYTVKVAGVRAGKVTNEVSEDSFRTSLAPSGDVVQFEDVKLENAVRSQLLVFDRDLLESDLKSLGSLKADNMGITSLKGLEHATYLYDLSLASNSITNIDPLLYFSELHYLNISDNPIQDISNLSKIKWLSIVYLNETNIKDLSVLLEMPSLYWVKIEKTAIDYKTDAAAKSIINTLLDQGVNVEYRSFGNITLNQSKVQADSIKIDWGFTDYGEGLPSSYKIFLNEKNSPILKYFMHLIK